VTVNHPIRNSIPASAIGCNDSKQAINCSRGREGKPIIFVGLIRYGLHVALTQRRVYSPCICHRAVHAEEPGSIAHWRPVMAVPQGSWRNWVVTDYQHL
jgi:hypothetical protein